MKVNRLVAMAGALALAVAAAPQALLAQADTGSANFSKYVAMGDSLTAGFASGALVVNYQQNSYPALIYRQVNGTAAGFQQPLVSSPGLGGTPGFGILRLNSLAPSITPVPGQGQPLNLTLPRPYDNMAVPGADVGDLVRTTQGGIHDLILRRAGATQLQQALSLGPTFVTLWIGNNDALGAATSGIVNDQTLTSVADFQRDYLTAVAGILQVGARYATATIPDVTTIPFVTAVGRTIPLGGQTFTLHGPDGPLGAGDFVLLTASALIPQGFGIPTALGGRGPLPDSAVLSASEVATIRARVAAFNNIIRASAAQNGAALFEADQLLLRAATTGVNIGGVTYSARFLTGGIFSYDGVHPTDLGYAVIANGFIEAINEQFDGEIPPVNLYPFMFGPPAFPTGASPAGAVGSLDKLVFEPASWQGIRPIVGADKADEPTKPNKPRKPRRRGQR